MISLTIIFCVVAAVWLTMWATSIWHVAVMRDYEPDEDEDATARKVALKVIALLTVAAVLVSVPFVIVLQAVAK